MKKIILGWMVLLAGAAICGAAEHGTASAPSHGAAHAADPSPHPATSEHPVWVRPVVTTVVLMFALAWIVGAFVRATMPEEIPQTHAHDEHHGHKDHGDTHGGHDAHGHASHH